MRQELFTVKPQLFNIMAKLNLVGLVVSQGKMIKTAKVRVQWKVYNKIIHKEVLKRRDYLVHDEGDLCREGDIVRIEAIPRISKRKTFAIAEIKVNKGHQFSLYEMLAKEQLAKETNAKLEAIVAKRQEFASTVAEIEDLRALDDAVAEYQNNQNADRDLILQEINRIKEKYNIKSWPLTAPILNLELNVVQTELSEVERRRMHFNEIYQKLSLPEFKEWRTQILSQMTSTDPESLAKRTAKNILRKYIVDPRNECPVPIPQ